MFCLISRSFIARLSAKRFYAAAATTSSSASAASISDQMKVTISSPVQTLLKDVTAEQVNLVASTGNLGILSKHIPTIYQLQPSVLEVIESAGKSKLFFVSGGYAIIHPDNTLKVNSIEVFSLDQFDEGAARKTIANAETVIKSAKSEYEKSAAELQLEIAQNILSAIGKK